MSWWGKPEEPKKQKHTLTERITASMLKAPWMPPYHVACAMMSVTQELERMEPRAQEVYELISNAFADTCAEIPQNLWRTKHDFLADNERYANTTLNEMTVPLYDLLPECGKVIVNLAGPFCGPTMRNAALFLPLRKRLLQNEAHASKASLYDPKRKIIAADEYDAPPEELIRLYLSGTCFYDFFHFRIPYRIAKTDYCRHTICIARPGWGKSQLLGLLTAEAINDPDRALILIDPKGPLFEEVKMRVPPQRRIIIDCDTDPPDLNIFDFGVSSTDDALNTFEFLLSSLAGNLSEKQQSCIEPLFSLLKNIEGASLVTLHDIITEKPKKNQPPKYASAIEKLDDIQRDFFNHLFYGSGEFQTTKDALQWKVSRALSRPAFRKMFSAQKNSIDIDRFVRDKMIVIVKGSETALGREGMRIFLLYLLSQYYAAGKRRNNIPQKHWHLAMLAIDEAHLVLQSPLIKSVLQELRQFNFAFLAATQLWDDVAKEVRPAILGATAIKIIGDVQRNDAETFARDMFTQGSVIQNLQAVEGSYGEWAIHVAPEKRSMRVRCPYGVLESLKTHEAPNKGASRESKTGPAEADTPIVPQQKAAPTGEERLSTPIQEQEPARTSRDTTTLPSTDDDVHNLTTPGKGGWAKP